MNLTVVRPLVDKYYALKDVSMVYCLLVNRTHFQREQLTQGHQQSVCSTRALFCELIANRILRRFYEDNTGAQGLLLLSQILVGGFDPFQGAPADVVAESSQLSWTIQMRSGYRRKLPALEIAIISESKVFLSSSACQMVVAAIYEGRVIYTPTSFIDILPDHYKQKPIALYNPRQAPILNQYRLIVPRTRNVLEVAQFIVLLFLFLFVMVNRSPSTFGGVELAFIIYTLGWVLDQFASILEHGWHVYTQNLWSFLDVAFSAIFGVYLVLRIHGWRTSKLEPAQQAMDVLAMGAPVLIPRLAFNLMSENMLFVSLRAMMRDFTVLTVLACWCFAGFLLSMTWLSNGGHEPITISKWMLWVWFGLDGTGIQRSVDFHWLLGPILMVAFAFLGNTLFLTILVSMLSTTFSTIVSNATAEIQFRRAVLTLEGVKSDAIFAYQPPFNILALFLLTPLTYVLTPRWFHKVNVAAVRVLNAPILLMIGVVERRSLWKGHRGGHDARLSRSRSRANLWDFSRGFSVHGDIQAVFDVDPPETIQGEALNESDPENDVSDEAFERDFGLDATAKSRRGTGKSRRDSIAPFGMFSGGVRDMLTEEDEDVTDSDTKSRLAKLEKATYRIERMLERLCGGADDDGSLPDLSAARDTSTMFELDRTGTSEIE
ncbi:hypothetical protein IFR04_015856 [Cadophora malorum]|uniref:Nonselective cation channel n=1 Tax=Cadophora malorum TaxID=108018 RepID=A0A8H7T212_9HELO|nr:hypothetical protein IFR04_015856 [Cadophora malorum]